MNRTAVSIVEVTNIKERDLIQLNTEVNFLKRNWAVTQLKTNVKFHFKFALKKEFNEKCHIGHGKPVSGKSPISVPSGAQNCAYETQSNNEQVCC